MSDIFKLSKGTTTKISIIQHKQSLPVIYSHSEVGFL